MPGKIYIVGAGPGRPDLLTIRAGDVLRLADAVFYDRLVSPEVLAMAAATAELHYVGKEEGLAQSQQEAILDLLGEAAGRVRHVVRLKGGDPFVFGRGAEEWASLVDRGFEVEVVPGVSSAVAVPASAGVPPTFRHVARGFAVVTGHESDGFPEVWHRYAAVDTLIVLMGVKHRVEIASALISAGRLANEPVCFIENGTTPRERVVVSTLGDVAAGQVSVSAPAVFVIGDVVRLREKLVPLVEQMLA